MGGLGLVIGGMIAAAFLLIAYWTITAEPPAPDEDRAELPDDEPHVLVARFQIESTAQLTPGMLLRRERYLVDPVRVPRRSKAMTWTMLLIALGGEEVAEQLGIQEIRDPENPDLGVSLIEADAIPDLVQLLEQALATPDALAAALTGLDPDLTDPAAVAFTLGGAPLGEQASAAEEAAAVAVELLRQARAAQDSPQSLYLSYRGEVRAPTVTRDEAVLFVARTGSITTADDYERIQAAQEAIEFHDERSLPLRSRTDALATLLKAAQDDLAAVEVSPAVSPDPLLGITIVIEPQDVAQVALPALERYLGERAEALVGALAGDDDPAPVAAALRDGVAPPAGDPSAALDAAALVRPLRDVAQAAADAGEAVYLAYLPKRGSTEASEPAEDDAGVD